MQNIDNNSFSKKLNQYFRKNIKNSFVSNESVIILTKDDEFYQFRRDYFVKRIKNSVIALSDNKSKIKSLIKESFVEELSYKNVIHFKSGLYHTIVCTKDGKVYRSREYLGNRRVDVKESKQQWNQFLTNQNIIEMCCGLSHTIVLTINGDVFVWIDQRLTIRKPVNMSRLYEYPFKLIKFDSEKVKGISCGSDHSMALTEKGRVYSWGDNDCGQLGIGNTEKCDSPKLVKLSEKLVINKISCGHSHSLLLSSDGDVYVCGDNKKGQLGTDDRNYILTPMKLSHSEKFMDIASQYSHSFSAAISVNSVYYIWGVCGENVITQPKDTEFKSFNDIFEYYFQISYKLIKEKIIRFKDDFIENNKYVKHFIENREIGEGGYGKVFEVSEKSGSNDNYAIKTIKFTAEYESDCLKELETSPIIHEMNHQNIVKYSDVWLENDFVFKSGVKSYTKNFILYIQMELCDKSLSEIMNEIKTDSNLFSSKTLTVLGYYIASKIFIEILEGVNYLHSQKSPIIHRDLKPENIMLKIEKRYNSFVKIADMGLATLHKFASPSSSRNSSSEQLHTIDRGTLEYMAPEVENGILDDNTKAQYGTKADIYSLGIIFKELLDIDIDRNYTNDVNEVLLLKHKYEAAKHLSIRMISDEPNERPDCSDLLGYKHLWAITEAEFDIQKESKKVLNSSERKESYVLNLLRKN